MSFGQNPIRERAQFPFAALSHRALQRSVLTRAHESPHAAPRLQNPDALEFGVNLRHGIGVDLQINGQLPHGGKLLADAQTFGGDGKADRPLKLRVNRRRIIYVDVKPVFHPLKLTTSCFVTLYYDNSTNRVSGICRTYRLTGVFFGIYLLAFLPPYT